MVCYSHSRGGNDVSAVWFATLTSGEAMMSVVWFATLTVGEAMMSVQYGLLLSHQGRQ